MTNPNDSESKMIQLRTYRITEANAVVFRAMKTTLDRIASILVDGFNRLMQGFQTMIQIQSLQGSYKAGTKAAWQFVGGDPEQWSSGAMKGKADEEGFSGPHKAMDYLVSKLEPAINSIYQGFESYQATAMQQFGISEETPESGPKTTGGKLISQFQKISDALAEFHLNLDMFGGNELNKKFVSFHEAIGSLDPDKIAHPFKAIRDKVSGAIPENIREWGSERLGAFRRPGKKEGDGGLLGEALKGLEGIVPQLIMAQLIMQPLMAMLSAFLKPLGMLTPIFEAFGEGLSLMLMPLMESLIELLMPFIPIFFEIGIVLAPLIKVFVELAVAISPIGIIFQIISGIMGDFSVEIEDVMTWISDLTGYITTLVEWINQLIEIIQEFFQMLGGWLRDAGAKAQEWWEGSEINPDQWAWW